MREVEELKAYYLYKHYVTPWDVKQYVYCPMIPWIVYHLGINEPPTESMVMGGEVDASYKEKIAEKLRLPKPWRIEVELEDNELGLHGKVDIIAGHRKLIVVEVKRYKRISVEHYQAQLLVYALLVAKKLGPVGKAILVYGDKVLEYSITNADILLARKLVEKTRRIIDNDKPPIVNQNQRKCNICWYRRYCPFYNT